MDRKKEAQKVSQEKLLQMSEISIILDTYDDVFSDFDPRPYSVRGLSEDFLGEAKRAAKDKAHGQIELELLIPKKVRNRRDELMVRKRLSDHFKKHHDALEKEVKATVSKGVKFVVFGIFLMIMATLILFYTIETSLLTSFLIIFFEPAGWFFFWEGLDIVLFTSKEPKRELKFYERMKRCSVHFIPY